MLNRVLTVVGLAAFASAYDESTGLRAMYLSGAAYCEGTSVQSWTFGEACSSQTGVSDVTTMDVLTDGSFGYVGAQNGQIIVSFRGSTNFANWVTNMDYF